MTENQSDRFDEFLRNAAREYNAPPATPREEIWTQIVAGRRTRSAELVARRRWVRWSVGIAAVLAVGVAIGRLTAPGRVMPEGTGELALASPAATYRAVAGDHFGRAETLITMFRAEARSGRSDVQVSNAARSLLTTNRLLLDSPVAADPRMRRLLEDLDLVLAQIAQLSAERGIDPTDLIVRALEHNGVLLRLRSAVRTELSVIETQGAL